MKLPKTENLINNFLNVFIVVGSLIAGGIWWAVIDQKNAERQANYDAQLMQNAERSMNIYIDALGKGESNGND